MKLVSICFAQAPRIPGLRPSAFSSIECDNPHEQLKHWRVSLRGPAVFLISPPGWMTGRRSHEWDPKGARVIHEIPRANCYLQWSGDEGAVDMIVKGKYESEPFGGPIQVRAEPAPEPEIDPKDLGDA